MITEHITEVTPRGAPMIGVGITTTPNRDCLTKTIKKWKRLLPEGARLVVHNDQHFEGISVAKNRLLRSLDNCEHIFLADDDTYPITNDWYKPYITSAEPHLQYNFQNGPQHWPINVVSRWHGHTSYDRSRGCMLYVERRVLGGVGGMHHAFGRHGHEHEDWSERIHRAGYTKRPFQDVDSKNFYCMDEDQSGISSVKFSEHQGWKYIQGSRLPLYAEYRDELRAPVLVARRNDNGHRDQLWRFLKQRYWTTRPVYEGYHKDGPFNRSLGLNIAATLAGNWDVAVFADSDSYANHTQLETAIETARKTQQAVSPFTRVVELDQFTTNQVLANGRLIYAPEPDQIAKVRTEPMVTQSMMIVVPRNIYEQIGGFDEGFVGWGGEDNAFWRAAEIVGGKVLRIEGDVFHLWHEPASREYQPTNNLRWMRYVNASTRDELQRAREAA